MSDQPSVRRWRARAGATVAALLVGLAACDDPFAFRWSDAPITALIYSLARPELGLVSGYSFVPPPGPAIVEAPNATGTWDFALDTRGGQMVLLPPGALGVTGRARISVMGAVNFDDVLQAPEDTLLYEDDQPVPVTTGAVYVVRSNRRPGSFGTSCVYYAKVEPLTVDLTANTLLFRYVASPVCNSRELKPPE